MLFPYNGIPWSFEKERKLSLPGYEKISKEQEMKKAKSRLMYSACVQGWWEARIMYTGRHTQSIFGKDSQEHYLPLGNEIRWVDKRIKGRFFIPYF